MGYRRRQVEWALWRLRTGAQTRRIAPPEFAERINRLLKVDAGAELPANATWRLFGTASETAGRNQRYSALDAFMLCLALDLGDADWTDDAAVSLLRPLRPAFRALLGNELEFASDRGPLVLAARRNSASPYSAFADPRSVEAIALVPPGDVAALLQQDPRASLLLMPLTTLACELAMHLRAAPVIKSGPIPAP